MAGRDNRNPNDCHAALLHFPRDVEHVPASPAIRGNPAPFGAVLMRAHAIHLAIHKMNRAFTCGSCVIGEYLPRDRFELFNFRLPAVAADELMTPRLQEIARWANISDTRRRNSLRGSMRPL
jgi:hypothetical protein